MLSATFPFLLPGYLFTSVHTSCIITISLPQCQVKLRMEVIFDTCCYYICKQLYYNWVVNSSRKTLNTNSGIRPYALVWYFYRIGSFGNCYNDD